MERITYFADVLLPLPVKGLFTYRVPFELNDSVSEGKRVVVQFGARKLYTALVRHIHEDPPQGYIPKYILSVVDTERIVNDIQFRFWEWISSYYLCHPGEVMNVALPSGLKLAGESKLYLNPAFDRDFSLLTDKEYLIAEALDIRKCLTIHEVTEIVENKKVIPLVKTMIEKGVVILDEEIVERYKPRIESYVCLYEKYLNEEELKKLFDMLESKRTEKQLVLLMDYISITARKGDLYGSLKKQELIRNSAASLAQLKALEKKGIFKVVDKVTSRLASYDAQAPVSDIELSIAQIDALRDVNEVFNQGEVALLHGVTSSGKTEIYIKLIHDVISQGKQVLYLLPEIALTTQIINRLRKYFGDAVGVYHSRYNEHERVEIWNRVNEAGFTDGQARYSIILGARSALFLPFSKLGLVIVDEEHDTSFKQADPAPRYHARDAAIYLARLHDAKVILGSATPCLETYYNSTNGKYRMVELSERFGGMEMPEIIPVDLREATRLKKIKSHFSDVLLDHISGALEKKEQVILFQNRRGFSLRLECNTCNWVPSCKHCDVTLTYHKSRNHLRCHYCGYSISVPEKCPQCSDTGLTMKGFGTEKVEEELSVLYPAARIARMDLDTTVAKDSLQRLINDFEDGNIDILVGTQMVTKGLDFDRVSVVGILNADSMLTFPDFRAYERSYQLMAQVAGRAGRKNRQGRVIIQTSSIGHPVIQFVVNHDYISFYNYVLNERYKFRYPPYFRLVEITLKHKEAVFLNEAAAELAKELRNKFGRRILGPEYPPVARIKNEYLKKILFKLEKDNNLESMKKELVFSLAKFQTESKYKAVRVIIDVDV